MNYLGLWNSFKSLGCENDKKIVIACRMYMDFQQRVSIDNITKHYDEEFDEFYLKCVKGEKKEPCIIMAIPCHSDLNLTELKRMQRKFTSANEGYSFYIAIVDTSGTVLTYEVTDGFRELLWSDIEPVPSTSKDVV